MAKRNEKNEKKEFSSHVAFAFDQPGFIGSKDIKK